MTEQVLPKQARLLLENFESAFSETWLATQLISDYIKEEYHGDRNVFLNEVSKSCDYFSSATALQTIFDYSEM